MDVYYRGLGKKTGLPPLVLKHLFHCWGKKNLKKKEKNSNQCATVSICTFPFAINKKSHYFLRTYIFIYNGHSINKGKFFFEC